jgi:hypothetical protein
MQVFFHNWADLRLLLDAALAVFACKTSVAAVLEAT